MIFRDPPVATVAINLRPRRGSWGGANQWAAQVARFFGYHNWAVRFDLRRAPDVVLMTHTGLSAHTSFGADDVARMKEKTPAVRCIHRINDNDIRKETSGMDEALARANRVADHTVFVSGWLRDHHAAKWFDYARPHSVIVPGADPRFFHPLGGRKHAPGEPVRLATHHWSDNWNKGFDVYRDIDELAAGPLKGALELWVIGRWPKEIAWKSARLFAPASGARLAGLLRECDAYVSASRFEPGAMHVAEGLQCGLPLLYHKDSGGTVGQGLLYGMEIGDDLESTLREFCGRLPELKKRLLASPPSGAAMANSYLQLAQRLIVDA